MTTIEQIEQQLWKAEANLQILESKIKERAIWCEHRNLGLRSTLYNKWADLIKQERNRLNEMKKQLKEI